MRNFTLVGILRPHSEEWRQQAVNYLFSLILAFLCLSCDSLEVDPPNYELTSELVFTDDATAEASIIGLYSSLMIDNSFASGGYQSVMMMTGLASDDFILNSPTLELNEIWNAAILPSNTWLEYYIWNPGYTGIYHTNAILKGLESASISEELHSHLDAEARFMRSFFYFNLLNIFGDLPLILGTDYSVNKLIPRSDTQEIYQQLIDDLIIAQEHLPTDYTFAGNERIRATKWAAKALLARIYLYTGEWEQAEAFSSEVLAQSQLYKLEEHELVFLKNSQEAIWQLQPVATPYTREGPTFIPAGTTAPGWASLTESLVTAFEEGDERLTHWVATLETADKIHYYPFKYKLRSGTDLLEYSMVLRLAEQVLIRAEARAQLGKTEAALEDLNAIRARSGLAALEILDQGLLLEAIYQERRTELFSEWGHRWFDLKRSGRAAEFLPPLKPLWTPESMLFPIPEKEMRNNPKLTQNPGYPI